MKNKNIKNKIYYTWDDKNIGYHCFDCIRMILFELGGLTFWEYAPMRYFNMIALQEKNIRQMSTMKISAEIKNKCEATYQILQELHMVSGVKKYNGATFAFDALMLHWIMIL